METNERNFSGSGKESTGYSQDPAQEDENGAGGKLGKERDEREGANSGDWDDLRSQSRTDESGNLGDSDPDPGGAGSTGSEATNSGNRESL